MRLIFVLKLLKLKVAPNSGRIQMMIRNFGALIVSPIPGTSRLLGGRAPGPANRAQLTAGSHPPARILLKLCLCVGWSSTFSSQISGLFANSRSLPHELLLLQLCTRAAGVTCHTRLVQSRAGLAAGLADHEWLPPREAFGQRRGDGGPLSLPPE